MPISIGIVGLPNVGKSTLFNAITQAGVEAQNYPFCTIEPNTGIVTVPDDRLLALSKLSSSLKTIHATIEFVDIAGLVKGASKGEGLGNQFLANIREVSAIVHVVRCFENSDVVHVEGKVDPLSDIAVINTELLLADLDMVEKALINQQKKVKTNNKEEQQKLVVLEKLKSKLEQETPIRQIELSSDEEDRLKGYHFLTQKPVIYVTNVDESEISSGNQWVDQVQTFANDYGDNVVIVSAKIEEELSQLSLDEQRLFLEELEVKESGLERLAKSSFSLLGLETYLTTGEKETRAWTIKKGTKAPQAAGVIHTDFETGFIRANVVPYDTFIGCGGWKVAREKGVIRQEGRDYVVQDGDVVEFLFNV